ncbi:unnamed protein product, partial [Gulo gulo]
DNRLRHAALEYRGFVWPFVLTRVVLKPAEKSHHGSYSSTIKKGQLRHCNRLLAMSLPGFCSEWSFHRESGQSKPQLKYSWKDGM